MSNVPKFLLSSLPAEMLQEIGSIVVAWSRLEYQLMILIQYGFGIPKPAARALTAGAATNVLCGTLRTLAYGDHWVKDDSIRKDMKALADDVGKSAELRHQYAHGIFVTDADAMDVIKRYAIKTTAQRITPQETAITVPALKEEGEKIMILVNRSLDLLQRLQASP